jgi:hypothetical protein
MIENTVYVWNHVTRKRMRVRFRFKEDLRAPPQGYGAPETYRVYVQAEGHRRFVGERYKPAPASSDPDNAHHLLRWCADVVGFAVAYVERPEEFDRSFVESNGDHVEQAEHNRLWWQEHGDELSLRFDGYND